MDIPGTFRCYNAMYSEGKQSGRKDYLQCTAFRKDTASASQCVGCGKCEKHCPQHIEDVYKRQDIGNDSVLLECKLTERRNNELIALLKSKFRRIEGVRGGAVAIESISTSCR